MAQLIDHLWQSTLVTLAVWLLCALTRNSSAALRLFLWIVAALKFLVPFSLLYALGGWIGFPVRHSAIPPPPALHHAVTSAELWAAPITSFSPRGLTLAGSALLALALTLLCGWSIHHELRRARAETLEEKRRVAADWTLAPAPLNFFQATVLAGAVFCALVAPMLAGALHDRVERQAALAIDTEALRSAEISVVESDWRFGDRTEVVATAGSVSIRKVNLKDLVAMVYGIGEFEVFGGTLPWLETPHYDVRVAGAVHSPRIFDAYALREPVTRYLNEQYGVSIRVNGDCQDPCLDQESIVVERIPWTLSKMIRGER